MEFKMSDKVYNVLAWITRFVIPGSGTLYFTVAQIWELPYGEQVLGTLVAIETFMAIILGISTANYNATKN